MTTRVKGCTIAFTKDIRVDDVESIVNAIKMITGVADVTLEESSGSDWMNRSIVKQEIKVDLLKLYNSI